MRRIGLALALVVASCAGNEEGLAFPPVESRWQIVGDSVECLGTVDEQVTPETGPATRHVCTWERVTVDGVPTCVAVLVFERADASAPWALVATLRSHATRCT